MKNLLFFFISVFVLISITAEAQHSFQIKMPREVSTLEVIDSGTIKVKYAVNKLIGEPDKNDDLHILEIGKSVSKYYSCNAFEEDSISMDFIGKPIFGGNTKFHRNITRANKFFWSEYYKDYSKNRLMEYAYMPMAIPNYQYSENIPDFAWEIHADTLTIMDYLCQKATCAFRGKDYTAWFCTDIPVNDGPWKFGGLPGLILKIYDEQNDYIFECIDIKWYNRGFLITKYDYNNYGTITRKKLLKLWGDVFDHYFQLSGDDGSWGWDKLPYKPLELE